MLIKANTEDKLTVNKSLTLLIICVAAFTAFGASTMVTVFLPYCEHALNVSIASGNHIFSIWVSIFFAVRIFGGYLGQKYFGYYWATSIGLLLACVGEAILASGTMTIFYIGLVLVSLGAGLYSANIGAAFSNQFLNNTANRSRAFVIYYVVMNLGAFFGDFLSGFLIKLFGYQWIFIFASIPLLIGLFMFIIFARKILPTRPQKLTYYGIMLAYIGLGVPMGLWLLHHIASFDIILILLFLGCIAYLLIKSRRISPAQQDRALIYTLFSVFSLLYWGLYMLFPSVVEVYIEHHIKVNLFGKLLQPSTIASLSPLF